MGSYVESKCPIASRHSNISNMGTRLYKKTKTKGKLEKKERFKQLRVSCRQVGSSERGAGWLSSCISL